MKSWTLGVPALVEIAAACSPAPQRMQPPPTVAPSPAVSAPATASGASEVATTALQDYEHADISALHLGSGLAASSIERDGDGRRVLRVRYRCPPDAPPQCDVWQDLGGADWRGAHALRFRIRTDKPLALSTSFIDGNGVGYTAHTQTTHGGDWETLVAPLDAYAPNRYFQPPDARVGAPLDLGRVRAFGFCPLDAGPGSFEVDEIALAR